MVINQSGSTIWITSHIKLKLLTILTLPDNDQVENAEVGINNAATDRLAFTLTSTARAVTGVTLAEEETHTSLGQHTLLHGETLFVIASADAHNIALQDKVLPILMSV